MPEEYQMVGESHDTHSRVTQRDLYEQIARLDGKIDAYIQTHSGVHAGEVERRLRNLEDHRLELDTKFATFFLVLRATFGLSLLSAVGVIVAILETLLK